MFLVQNIIALCVACDSCNATDFPSQLCPFSVRGTQFCPYILQALGLSLHHDVGHKTEEVT